MDKGRIKGIALDLDGTTLRNDGSLSDRTRSAIRKAIEQEIYVIVASGRSFGALPKEVLELEGLSYAITSNGANGYDARTGKRMFSHVIKEEILKELLEKLREKKATIEIFIDGIPYAQKEYVENPIKYGATQNAVSYIQSTRTPIENMYEFAWQHGKHIDSLDIIVEDESKKREFRRMAEGMRDLYVTSSVPSLVEISDVRAGKAEALKYLAGICGIRMDEMAAFGNAENDLEMMQCVGYGVAVANAPEEILAKVPYHTASNQEDGVAIWLEEYFSKL